jgi:hypothetical protein
LVSTFSLVGFALALVQPITIGYQPFDKLWTGFQPAAISSKLDIALSRSEITTDKFRVSGVRKKRHGSLNLNTET